MSTIKLSSFTNEAASRTKGAVLKHLIEEALKSGERNIC